VRVVGLLSWYDEKPAWLRDAIRSFAPLLDALVAIDGAYHHYPDAKPASDPAQHRAVLDACQRADLPVTLVVPPRPWPSEMAKRSALFLNGSLLATPGDWYCVIDADERLMPSSHPHTIRGVLSNTPHDCGDVTFVEPKDGEVREFPIRIIFRALPGLRVEGNHWTYVTGDGRVLWGTNCRTPAADLTKLMRVEHLTYLRPRERHQRQHRYYTDRDAGALEVPPCMVCGERGVDEIPTNWRIGSFDPATGHVHLGSDWAAVCATHQAEVESESLRQRLELGQRFGVDLADVQIDYDNRVPAERRGIPVQ
jgi:hypothetical protein